MARTKLTTEAVEESTYAVTLTFADETGAAVAPNSGLTWTLTDETGTVINSRTDVAIASASSVTVVLSGDDLALPAGTRTIKRLLAVEGTYNSSLGVNLPLRDEVEFVIRELVAV